MPRSISARADSTRASERTRSAASVAVSDVTSRSSACESPVTATGPRPGPVLEGLLVPPQRLARGVAGEPGGGRPTTGTPCPRRGGPPVVGEAHRPRPLVERRPRASIVSAKRRCSAPPRPGGGPRAPPRGAGRDGSRTRSVGDEQLPVHRLADGRVELATHGDRDARVPAGCGRSGCRRRRAGARCPGPERSSASNRTSSTLRRPTGRLQQSVPASSSTKNGMPSLRR